jgi:hypothetical protein
VRNLTMRRYADAVVADRAAALVGLPDLAQPVAVSALKLGTDSRPVTIDAAPENSPDSLALSLALFGASGQISLDSAGQIDGNEPGAQVIANTEETAFSTPPASQPPVGFEPTTCGLQNRCSAD